MSKAGGIAYLLKHGRAPYPTVTRTEMPRAKGVKRMAEGGETTIPAVTPANAPLNYGTVPDYVFVPGSMEIGPNGKPVWKSGRYELRSPAAPAAAGPAAATASVGVPYDSGRGGGDRASQNESSWGKMSDTEKAAYYAANPAMAALTQFGQQVFGLTTLGAIAKALDPIGWKTSDYVARGIDPLGPEGYGTGGGSFAGMGPSGNENMSLGDQYSSYGAGRAAAEAAAAAASTASPVGDFSGEVGGRDSRGPDGGPSGPGMGPGSDAGRDHGNSGSAPGGGAAAGGLAHKGRVRHMAAGGIGALADQGGFIGSYAAGGRMLKGPGDGLSDHIPAVIGKGKPARLADGEFVVSADVVSALGGGSTEAGARKLYAMMDRIRTQAHGTKKQVKKVSEKKVLPA